MNDQPDLKPEDEAAPDHEPDAELREPWEAMDEEAIPDFSRSLVEPDPLDSVGITPRVALGNDLDIDAALASVASLSDVIAQREAEESAEQARIEAEQRAAEEAEQRRSRYYFPRPPAMTLARGQLASIVPALVLMVVGAWLTFSLSTSETPLDAGLTTFVVLGSAGLCVLAYWLSSERWSVGSAAVGLALIFAGAVGFYLPATDSVGIPDGWTLFIAALGAAIVVGALLSHTAERGRQAYTGLLILITGMAGYAVTTGMLPQDASDAVSQFGLPLLAIVAVLAFVPLVLRRRR